MYFMIAIVFFKQTLAYTHAIDRFEIYSGSEKLILNHDERFGQL